MIKCKFKKVNNWTTTTYVPMGAFDYTTNEVTMPAHSCMTPWGAGEWTMKPEWLNKINTWHVESNHILQPPNYLIIVVNRFRYINNQVAKDKCSIPMDMTVVLGYHKFSLQATIDHHGPSIYSGHYTTSVNCCNGTFYCNDNKITEFDMINTKNSSTAYVVIYKLIT